MEFDGLPIDLYPLSWYNVRTFAERGGLFMSEQVNKSPVSIGLLAHVRASRREPQKTPQIIL